MMLSYFYHWLMYRYWGWRKHRSIAWPKRQGRKHGLPSLDDYTDDQIVEGFRQIHKRS